MKAKLKGQKGHPIKRRLLASEVTQGRDRGASFSISQPYHTAGIGLRATISKRNQPKPCSIYRMPFIPRVCRTLWAFIFLSALESKLDQDLSPFYRPSNPANRPSHLLESRVGKARGWGFVAQRKTGQNTSGSNFTFPFQRNPFDD